MIGISTSHSVEFAYDNAIQDSTWETPFMLEHGSASLDTCQAAWGRSKSGADLKVHSRAYVEVA